MIPFPEELSDFYVEKGDCVEAGGIDTYAGRMQLYSSVWNALNYTVGYQMGWCGAGTMENMGVSFPNSSEQTKQNYVAAMMQGMGFPTIRYYILSDYQLQNVGNTDLICLLDALGSLRVNSTPNQNHGPSDLHLYMWSPKLNKQRIFSYIHLGSYEISGTFIPLWWTDLSEKEQQAKIEENSALIQMRRTKREKNAEMQKRNTELAARAEALTWIENNPQELMNRGWIKNLVNPFMKGVK